MDNQRTAVITAEDILAGLSPAALGYFFPGLTQEFAVLDQVVITTLEPEDEDARIKALHRELKALKKRYKATDEDIDKALAYEVKPSRLLVTRDYRLFLEDYGGEEIRMSQLDKTVYILFLRHPEGICFKDISDYRHELEEVYTRITDREDNGAIQRSLDSLVDTVTSNSLNEKVSRTRKAFSLAVDERIARHYYIEGEKGGVRRIPLDRSLVIWE